MCAFYLYMLLHIQAIERFKINNRGWNRKCLSWWLGLITARLCTALVDLRSNLLVTNCIIFIIFTTYKLYLTWMSVSCALHSGPQGWGGAGKINCHFGLDPVGPPCTYLREGRSREIRLAPGENLLLQLKSVSKVLALLSAQAVPC